MPQLPSVSELMVGAHLPMFDRTLLKQPLPQVLPSETTPRHLDSYLLLPNHKQNPPSPHHQPRGFDGPYLAANPAQPSGNLTPPGLVSTMSVSPRGSIVPQMHAPAGGSAPGAANITNSASAGASSSTKPPFAASSMTTRAPPAYANLAPFAQAPGDYFSYRGNNHGHYSAYKRTGLVLLLLESMLRMPLAPNTVPRVGLSPTLPLSQNRLSLFSHESSHGYPPQYSAYQAAMAPVVYGQSFAPYPNSVPLQTVLRQGAASAGGQPMPYGLPPLGQAVIQPYGIQMASPYQQVMVGAAQAPPPMPTAPAQGMADQNYALMNKRRIIKRRTRTGCLTCRKRRIKCDERKPHCFNCERLKKLCLGYEVLPTNPKRRDLENVSNPHRSSVHDLL